LILVPEKWNYFYQQHGRRLAEALTDLGFKAEISSLNACPDRTYDWCVLTNISEVMYDITPGGPNEGLQFTPEMERGAVARLRQRGRKWGAVAACSLDCVSTVWYQLLQRRCDAVGIDTILDFGLHSQAEALSTKERESYVFLFNGLTSSEEQVLEEAHSDKQRSIPWAFVGHSTRKRIALVHRLVREVDPRGFVYMPDLAPITEKNSPHISQGQYEAVLRHARYQVWCTHHDHFYMESERFRMSLLGGSVPIKAMPSLCDCPEDVPFAYLLVEEEELAPYLARQHFASLRQRFQNEFRSAKSLKTSLSEYLTAAGILCPLPDETTPAALARPPRRVAS
jgi:hypothetical protein